VRHIDTNKQLHQTLTYAENSTLLNRMKYTSAMQLPKDRFKRNSRRVLRRSFSLTWKYV